MDVIDLKNYHRFDKCYIFHVCLALIIHSVSNIIDLRKLYIEKILSNILINLLFNYFFN